MNDQTNNLYSLKLIAASLNNLAAKLHDIQDLTDTTVEIYLEALQAMKHASEQNRHEEQEQSQYLSVHRLRKKLKMKKVDCECFLRKRKEFVTPLNCLTVCPKTLSLKDEEGFLQAIHITHDELEDDHLLSAIILYNVGLINMKKGLLHYSLQFLSLAFSTVAKRVTWGCSGSLLCLLIQHNMGLTYHQFGMFKEAKNAFSESLKFGRLSRGHKSRQSPRTLRRRLQRKSSGLSI